LTAVLSFVLVGRGTASETRTLALVPATMPKAMAKETAAANVRAAIPSIEAFHTDHGTYAGATVAALRRDYDSGIGPFVKLGWGDKTRYCIESTVGGQTMSVTQPGTDILSGGC